MDLVHLRRLRGEATSIGERIRQENVSFQGVISQLPINQIWGSRLFQLNMDLALKELTLMEANMPYSKVDEVEDRLKVLKKIIELLVLVKEANKVEKTILIG